MAVKIAFANQKGGVGKSTITTQTAFFLSEVMDKKVLIIDMDAQGNASATILRDEPITGTLSHELLSDSLKSVEVMHTDYDGIDLIASPKNDIDGYEAETVDSAKALLPAKYIASIEKNYDYILIDCPPSLGRKLLGALCIAQYVLSPIKVSGYAIDGLNGLISTVNQIKKIVNKKLKILGIVVNELDKSASNAEALNALREAIPNLVFKSSIRHRSPIDRATMEGLPIWKVRSASHATAEIRAVVNEMLERIKKLEKK